MQDRSVAKRKRGLYYGWWIVLSAFMTIAATFGLKTYVFGIFIKPLSENLGWSRAAVVGVVPANAILGGVLAPFVGRYVDRQGPRVGMFFGAILAGLALLAISRADSLWQWYLLWLVYTLGDSFAGMVPNNTAIANWFIKKRGTALGIVYVAVSAGGLVLVPVVTGIVTGVGWSWGFVLLGLLMILLIAPLSGLIMRRRPEDLGLRPDGAEPLPEAHDSVPGKGSARAQSREDEPSWTLGQAARTAPFWLVVLASGSGGGTANIVSVHAMAFSTDLGIPPAAAAGAIGLLLVVAMPGRFLYGWLCDRIDIRYVIMLYLSGLLVAALVMSQMRSLAMLYISVVIFGLSVGGVNPVLPTMTARLYGRANMGRIWGTMAFLSMPLVSGAPLLAGYVYDTVGSYQLAFYFAAAGLIVAIGGIYFARRPAPSGIASPALPDSQGGR